MERLLEHAEKQIRTLGKTKLSILQGSLRRFNAYYSRFTNVEGIASNDEEKERLIQFNDTLPEMVNNVRKVSILLGDGIKSVNAGTLESIGVFGVVETFGTESKEKKEMEFTRGLIIPYLGSSFVGGSFNPLQSFLNWFKPKPVQKEIPERNEDVENFRSLMAAMGSRAEQMNLLLIELEDFFRIALKEMISLARRRGFDCSNYSDDEEQIVFTAYKFAEAINCLLNTGLQTDEGKLNDKEFEEAFRNGQALLSAFD